MIGRLINPTAPNLSSQIAGFRICDLSQALTPFGMLDF
jgi:hypothetical protein